MTGLTRAGAAAFASPKLTLRQRRFGVRLQAKVSMPVKVNRTRMVIASSRTAEREATGTIALPLTMDLPRMAGALTAA